MLQIRPYGAADELAWLRCRLLSFLDTCYYDDVWTQRPFDCQLTVALVAVEDDELVGLIAITTQGNAATIDTIAVHPDAQRRGLGSALLNQAVLELPDKIVSLDAWTREDQPANRWYRSHGFIGTHRYLHVYKNGDEPDDGFLTPDGLSAPVTAFMHASVERENEMRQRFRRVYVCRQYLMNLQPRT